jgi:hypothetical protein
VPGEKRVVPGLGVELGEYSCWWARIYVLGPARVASDVLHAVLFVQVMKSLAGTRRAWNGDERIPTLGEPIDIVIHGSVLVRHHRIRANVVDLHDCPDASQMLRLCHAPASSRTQTFGLRNPSAMASNHSSDRST